MLERDLKMSKSHTNLVSFDENGAYLSGSMNLYERKKTLKVTKLTSWMNFRMIQAMIKCFEKSTVERIEENSNDVSRCLFIRKCK